MSCVYSLEVFHDQSLSMQGLVWLLDSQGAARKDVALDLLRTSLAHASVMKCVTSGMTAVMISPKLTALRTMVHTCMYFCL